MDNPNGHINWYAVLETKRLLLRPNTNATWITTHQIETYSTPCMYTLFATSTAYRLLCEHMRAFAYDASAYNASICECAHSHRMACERISHASCEHSHTLFGRLPCPLCAHMRAFASHSHRMRSHSHRMRSHRMRMRAFKGNLCVSGTVPSYVRDTPDFIKRIENFSYRGDFYLVTMDVTSLSQTYQTWKA